MRCKKKVGTIVVKLAPMDIRRVLVVGKPDVAAPKAVSGWGTDGGQTIRLLGELRCFGWWVAF